MSDPPFPVSYGSVSKEVKMPALSADPHIDSKVKIFGCENCFWVKNLNWSIITVLLNYVKMKWLSSFDNFVNFAENIAE